MIMSNIRQILLLLYTRAGIVFHVKCVRKSNKHINTDTRGY